MIFTSGLIMGMMYTKYEDDICHMVLKTRKKIDDMK